MDLHRNTRPDLVESLRSVDDAVEETGRWRYSVRMRKKDRDRFLLHVAGDVYAELKLVRVVRPEGRRNDCVRRSLQLCLHHTTPRSIRSCGESLSCTKKSRRRDTVLEQAQIHRVLLHKKEKERTRERGRRWRLSPTTKEHEEGSRRSMASLSTPSLQPAGCCRGKPAVRLKRFRLYVHRKRRSGVHTQKRICHIM